MKKTISYYLVLVLGLLLIPNVVKALQVDSLEELKAAFNDTALIEGNKITLTDDVYLDDVIEMTSGDYILDLAGFSFESDGQYFFDLTNTKLVITGDGTIYNSWGGFSYNNEDSIVIIKNGTFETDAALFTYYEDYSALTEENAPKVVIENGSFESLNGCIIDMYSGIVEIFNGEFTTNRDYTTIYMDTDGGYVDLHIHNGSFTADEYSSISTSGGNVTIDNGTFSSNEGTLSYYDNDYQDIAEKTIVTINGGTFKSQGITIDYDGLYDDDNEAVDLVINGGSFESANEFALVAESGDIRINGGSFQGKLGAVKIMDKEDVTGLITGGSFKATGIGSIGYVGAISLLKDFPEESITSYFNDITIIDPDTINEDYVLLGDHYSTTSAEVLVKEQKNITITKSTYGEVSVDNSKHYPGDKVLVTITPELGYELDTISIVSKRTNTAISLASDNSFILPNEDVTITATFKASQFEVTTGEGQNITIPEDKTATFVIDADYSLFKGAYVDNKALVEGTDCVTKEGSTIITLQEKLLNSLEEGEHELKVLFTNDTEIITNFTIEEAIVNPSTYDGIFNTLVLGLISLIFVVSSFFSIKKKRTN